MAFSKITTRGITGDTLEAGDIAANAVGASELADDAVDTAAIADNAVTNAKIPNDLIQVKPHIKPGKLEPAVDGMLMGNDVPVIKDHSPSKHTLYQHSKVVNDKNNVKNGKRSISFHANHVGSGTGGSYINIGASGADDFEFGTGAFTIEYWVWELDYDWGDHGHMSTSRDEVGWAIQRAGTYLYFTAQGDAFGSAPASGNKIIARANLDGHVSNSTWYHVAIVRVSASDLKIYINGTDRTAEADAGGTHDWGYDHASHAHVLVVGRSYPDSNEKYNSGYFDDIRICKGLAVYTGNFTAPTAHLTTTWSAGTNIAANSTASNVKCLVHGDVTDGSGNYVTTGYHSGAYGTAQSDGHSYYYTDIKGSRSIKDPRIGAHFGGQRHKFRSKQLLDQETSMQNKSGGHTAVHYGSDYNNGDVYAVDGRDWIRAVDVAGTLVSENDGNGQRGLQFNETTTNAFLEATGYFSDVNLCVWTRNDFLNDMDVYVDGTLVVEASTTIGGRTTVASPLAGRYVDPSSVVNTGVNQTLGIHTIKFVCSGANYFIPYGIEFLVQDTGTDARRSQINIPAQNVISYGKKFSIGSDTLTDSVHSHYNPFNGMSGAKTLTELGTYIDTATSLGMDNWKAGTSNYYKPFNGGRVVKWIASDGTIKTSVTMMPPNAQKHDTTAASNAFSDAEVQAGTNDHTITFDQNTIDHSLSEVAKSHSIFEFGNGACNAGRNANYADATQLWSDEDDIAFCMDDGLTSLVAHGVKSADHLMHRNDAATYYTHTFIGTGISLDMYWGTYPQKDMVHIAQNLPYGTHTCINDVKDSHTNEMLFKLDGVSTGDSVALGNTPQYGYITYHQPKMPPIPEDACIIADYMLMADYVVNTSATVGAISKGVRRSGASRDHHYECASSMTTVDTAALSPPFMFSGPGSGSHTMPVTLPYFGTSFTSYAHDQSQTHTFTLDGSAVTPTELDGDGISQDMFYHTVSTLGTHKKVHTLPAGGYRFSGTDVATPTHTSSHYHEFEGPNINELVGGDRNMEQHNLIVTPDGKTWDEVNRDTSYIGNVCVVVATDTVDPNHDTILKTAMHWRGKHTSVIECGNKNFAISYDRLICLVDGWYRMSLHLFNDDNISSSDWAQIRINNNRLIQTYQHDQSVMTSPSCSAFAFLRRRDYITIHGANRAGDEEGNRFEITKLEK